jgi:putative tryptophan/tyrosine transport system substrate-binding protein
MKSRCKATWAALKLVVAIVAFSDVGATVSHAAETEPKGTIYRVGFLWGLPPIAEWTAALDEGLAELGWVSGRNIVIEHRSADGHFDRLPALTAELIGLKVKLIVALSAPETAAAKKLTGNIPIVFVVHGDPIGTGDIQSLAHPGGNITGLCQQHPELSTKQLDLLKQIAPNISRVAVLWNAANPAKQADWRELEPAARTLAVVLRSVEVRRPEDFDGAFAAISEQHPDAMLTLGDPLTVTMRTPLANFALRENLPAMFTHRQFVEVGGLASYGANFPDLFRRAAGYVDKILKGANPGDLPVQQPVKFELFLNLKTAKALGLTIPPSVLQLADQVIE